MERVKVTQEQAELMEEVRVCASVSELCYERCLNGSWIGVFKPLNELNADEFARALYIGYEVEPNFAKGDWVKSKIGKGIGKIIHLKQFGYETDFGLLADTEDIRHATEEEIAEEKERRMSNKIKSVLQGLTEEEFNYLKKSFDDGVIYFGDLEGY